MSEIEKTESFEQTLERLEALVKTMEAGGMPLEEMLKTYEEGIALSRRLQGQLKDAQGKLEELSQNGDVSVLDADGLAP